MSSRLFGAIKARLRAAEDSDSAVSAANAPDERGPGPSPLHRRFLSDNPMLYEQAVAAAQAYVSRMPPAGVGWLHAKPYDPAPGSVVYFRLMYDLLNVLQAMQLPPRARILEVGSGPGWITEILLMLGHEVDALEPSADMIAVARERCAGLKAHFRTDVRERARFHHGTLEELDFPADHFDAVLYFDVLHHVVDERACIDKTFRFLRAGGCVAVVEAAWHPQFKELEAGLRKEMEEYGTLENPFSIEYLDQLLGGAGFVGIKRYVGVNGFFGEEDLNRPLAQFGAPLHGVNNVIARKPIPEGTVPSCDDLARRTDVRYTLVEGALDAACRSARLQVTIANCGETLLDNSAAARAPVTFALRRGAPGSAAFVEATKRCALVKPLLPGEAVTMLLQFTLPADVPLDGWELDGVAEGHYWFSLRGIASLPVGA